MPSLKTLALVLALGASSSAFADQWGAAALAWNADGNLAFGYGYTVDQAKQDALSKCSGCSIANVIYPTGPGYIVVTQVPGTMHLYNYRSADFETAKNQALSGCAQMYHAQCVVTTRLENADLTPQ